MPLEIGEIGISVSVGEGDGDGDGARRGKGKAEKEKAGKEKKARAACCDFDRQEIVDDCVRLVLQALRAARER